MEKRTFLVFFTKKKMMKVFIRVGQSQSRVIVN